jgi:hypothetical protein
MSKTNNKAAKPKLAAAPRVTKIDTLLQLLKRPEGADVKQLAEATGWQLHSVRGALSGHVKKKLGLKVEAEKTDGRLVYRIEA